MLSLSATLIGGETMFAVCYLINNQQVLGLPVNHHVISLFLFL